MSKVTSKLQLTVPKAIADEYGIRPGDELQWTPAGESIRIELGHERATAAHELTATEKLELFDRGSDRLNKIQKAQLKAVKRPAKPVKARDWTRQELYHRGFPR